jgi:hypothetical protein
VKFRLERDVLADAVAWAARTLPTRPTVPVLAGLRIDAADKEITFTPEGKRAILNKLVEAEGFEKFLDVKYTGTKRFGLEGAEAMVPALEQIIKRGGHLGLKEIVIVIAHLGRLNNLTRLHLRGTYVGNTGLEHLGGLTQLTVLMLRNTAVGDW